MPAWEVVPEAVKQLIEEINWITKAGESTFFLNSITIKPDRDNPGGLVVAAFDDAGPPKPFVYAMFIRADGRIEADGY